MTTQELNRLYEIERKIVIQEARNDILKFAQYIDSSYRVNWHHRALAQKLNAFVRGDIRFLMVFMPPRHGKSQLVSRNLPAFLHGHYPDAEIMAASYSDSLAGDMCVDTQKIMDTPEYAQIFPKTKLPPPRSLYTLATRNSSEHHILGHRGKYRAQGVGGWFTGKGANFVLVDDPIKGREVADSVAFREKLWNFWNNDLFSRLEVNLKSGKRGQVLITQTRWHEDDLSGRLLQLAKTDEKAVQWEVISFPAVRTDMDNPDDPRALGEALWPLKYNLDELEKIKASAGARAWSSLYQQNPVPDEGNLIKREWWRWYGPGREKNLPTHFDTVLMAWDFAVQSKQTSDWTVGCVWGRKGTDKFLLDQVRVRVEFPAACQTVVSLCHKWPSAYKKLVENKANGPAIIQTLKARISGLVEVEPKGDKVARVNAIAPEIEGGNVFLPDPSLAPWIHDYLEEWSSFPLGKHDDAVDASTYAIDELRKAQILYTPSAGHGSYGQGSSHVMY